MTTTDTQTAETVTIERPEGISDGRWATLQRTAHLVLTGHQVWCDEHVEIDGDPRGFCQHEYVIDELGVGLRLNNGTLDGSVVISGHGDMPTEMTPRLAWLLGAALEQMADMATSGIA